jgi:hypothetical protein
MSSTLVAGQIQDMVERFSVCYAVCADSTVVRDHSIRQVGFCLDLYGRDGNGPPLSPGDERSKEIYRTLREIALQIVPEGGNDCRFELDKFYPSLQYGNNPRSPARVQLTIHILHKNGFDRPIDAAVTQALRELEDRLRYLGIPHANGR